MQTHRFILIEDAARPGWQSVMEITAGDAARIYTAHQQAMLALGQTIDTGDVQHTDMQAFIRCHRAAASALRPRPAMRGLQSLLLGRGAA